MAENDRNSDAPQSSTPRDFSEQPRQNTETPESSVPKPQNEQAQKNGGQEPRAQETKNPVLLLRMRLQRQAATSLQMLVRISPARRLPNRPQQVQSPRRRDTNLLLIRSPHPQTRQKITKGLQTMQGQAPDRARDNNHMRHRLEAGTTRSQVLNQIMVNPLRALRSLKAMGEQLVRISAGSVQL